MKPLPEDAASKGTRRNLNQECDGRKYCRHERAFNFAMQYFTGDTTEEVERIIERRYRDYLQRTARHA